MTVTSQAVIQTVRHVLHCTIFDKSISHIYLYSHWKKFILINVENVEYEQLSLNFGYLNTRLILCYQLSFKSQYENYKKSVTIKNNFRR